MRYPIIPICPGSVDARFIRFRPEQLPFGLNHTRQGSGWPSARCASAAETGSAACDGGLRRHVALSTPPGAGRATCVQGGHSALPRGGRDLRTGDSSGAGPTDADPLDLDIRVAVAHHGPGTVSVARVQVPGITGLRVVDASVMHAITRGTTYAPSVMVGERAAELILGAA
nr:GMC oxidoreductase [Streptomyces sp. 3212.3]